LTKGTIEHFGVKGMHWGVRRSDIEQVGKLASEASKGLGTDKTKAAFNQKVSEAGGLHSISDKDLRSMLERMDMEKRYSKFMSEESERRANGKKAAIKALLKIGQIALPLLIGSVATKSAGPTVFRTVSQFQKSIAG
jgi:hypothetical protein